MKRLYTLALSALVLAASATVAVPTMRMAKAKSTETISERVAPRTGLAKVSPQRTIAYRMQENAAASVVERMQKMQEKAEFVGNAAITKLPANPAKVKAKAAGSVPATAADLVAMQWKTTFKGVFQSQSSSYSGVATFSLEEDEKLYLTVPGLPPYATKMEVSYADGVLTIPGMAYAGMVNVTSVGECIAVSVPMTINFATSQVAASMEDVAVQFNAETQSFDFDPDWAWGIGALSQDGQSYLGHLWAGYGWTLTAVEGDYSISVAPSSVCNAENKFTFSVTLGADVAQAKYLVMPDDVPASLYSSYIKGLGEVCVVGETYTVEPTKATAIDPITESGYASVLFATYDAEGNVMEVTEQAFIVVVEGEEGWKNVGEVDYEDQLFTQYYENPSHTQKAMLQAKTDQPGLYRIVEPYSEYPGYHSADCGHHYFMLNIADPEWVEVPFSVSGVDAVGDGILTFGTCVVLGYDKETGPEKGFQSGTLEGQTVTLPVRSLLAREQYYNKPGGWNYLTGTSAVTFTFPDINLNLTVVDSDNAPLEGVTVALGEVTATTNAEGKATVKVPFETGYFATVKPTINDTEVEITLNGAETDYTHTVTATVSPEPATVEILPTDFNIESPTAEAVKDGFTAMADKNGGQTAPAYNANAGAIRLYATNTLTISGQQITKVVFDIDAKNNAKRYTTFTPSTGALSAAQAAGDTQITWNGDAASVTFTVGETAVYGTESDKAGQVHITKITVYGLPGSSQPQVYEVANIDEFLTAADKAHNTTITGEVTVTYQNGKYLYVTDETGSLQVYGSLDKTYTNGTKLTGIAGKYGEYNSMPQMVPQTDSFTDGTAGDEVAPTETTLALVALGEYVVVKGVSIVADGDNFNVTDGTTTLQLFNRFNIEGIEAAENVTITGIGSIFGETLQIFPISIVAGGETPGPEPETWTLLEGKGMYAPSVMTAMYEDVAATPVEVDVYESDQRKGVYKFAGVWPDLADGLELVIDATDPDYVVVPVQNTGYVDEVDGITYIASASAIADKADVEAQGLVITMQDGYISIPANALVLRWPEAPENSVYETDPETWYLGRNCPDGYALLPGGTVPDPNEGWESLGNATLMDGWVIPAFGDQTDPEMWYTVELQQNKANENLYRLVAPYHSEGFPYLEKNECETPGYIQFDVTDPDHVVFATNVAAGFATTAFTPSVPNMYCSNALGTLVAILGGTPEQVIAYVGDKIPYTTFKDGVVSLDAINSVDEDTGESEPWYDATYGTTPGDPGYGWTDEQDNPANMTARIWFPGVTPSYTPVSIREITAEAGTETMYNLRGQRVGKVAAPGIYIKNNRKVVVK